MLFVDDFGVELGAFGYLLAGEGNFDAELLVDVLNERLRVAYQFALHREHKRTRRSFESAAFAYLEVAQKITLLANSGQSSGNLMIVFTFTFLVSSSINSASASH